MTPSAYQEAICDQVRDPSKKNAVVQAVAGSGKTSTLRLAAEAARVRVKAVCFNKDAATHLARKMPPNADCSTLHSVGLRAWGRSDVSGEKSKRIFKWLQERGSVPRWLQPSKVCKVVGLAKNEGLVPQDSIGMSGLVADTTEQWQALLDHYGVETDERVTMPILVDAASQVLKESIKWGRKIVDFDDMLYLPTLTDGCTFPTSPWVFVDELQDVSGLQREMVLRMVAGGGRFLGVGDRAQAIYGFRGADVTSMDTIARRTAAVEMPLSTCYRCPKSVIALAQEIVPQIEATADAEEGLVEHRDDFKLSEIQADHLIVCRNRAPMVKLAYRLLGIGAPVRILGRSTGDGLVTYIEHFNCRYVEDMLDALDRATTKAIARAQKRDDEAAIDEAIDRQETIRAIAEGCNAEETAALCNQVRGLFSGDGKGKVMVGTIHAVKGLEADHVWFLDEHLIPSRGARLEWQRQQEQNLRYVAITRARKSLRFINSETAR